MRTELIYEIILIGIFNVILLWPIYYLTTGKFPEKNIQSMIIGMFILGGSLHFILEMSGVNKYWCKNTNFD